MDDDARRIGAAWRQLRRGSSMHELRQLMYGGARPGDQPLDVALGDALDVVVELEPVRMGDLAAALKVDASTATRTVARLEDAGLARRQGCMHDRRAVEVVATAKGRKRQAAMVVAATETLEEILEAFPGDERAELADLLDRLVGSLDRVVARRRGD